MNLFLVVDSSRQIPLLLAGAMFRGLTVPSFAFFTWPRVCVRVPLSPSRSPPSCPRTYSYSSFSFLANNHNDDDDDEAVSATATQRIVPVGSGPGLMEGDFAGHSANFRPDDGTVISVPYHLVPKSMLEWGDVPHCLEVLTSERWRWGTNANRSSRRERVETSIMPEVGCGVDNLDTMVEHTDVEFDTSLNSDSELDHDHRSQCEWAVLREGSGEEEDKEAHRHKEVMVLANHHPTVKIKPLAKSLSDDKTPTRIETVFVVPSASVYTHPIHGTVHDTQRIRVNMEMELGTRAFKRPISITSERKTSNVCTMGEIAVGGGLDGRTVSELIGIDNINRPFVDKRRALNTTLLREQLINTSWRRHDNGEIITYTESSLESHLFLPPGILFHIFERNQGSVLYVKVSLVNFEDKGTSTEGNQGTHHEQIMAPTSLAVVQRKIEKSATNKFDISTEIWLESSV